MNVFTFKVTYYGDRNDCCDMFKYVIGIDGDTFLEDVTAYYQDFRQTRAGFERYVAEGNAEIVLDDDTDLTTVRMVRREKDGKKMTEVDIIPYRGVCHPLHGLCDEHEFLSVFYFGLLYANSFLYDEIGCGANWDYCKMVQYNVLKSRMVEHYLCTGETKHFKDYIVRHILAFSGKEILYICDETPGYHVTVGDVVKIPVIEEDKVRFLEMDGSSILKGNFECFAQLLPSDCDFWLVPESFGEPFAPILVLPGGPADMGEEFVESERPFSGGHTIWYWCNTLNKEMIMLHLSLGADNQFLLRWILNSNNDGTTDSAGNYTYQESELIMRNRDKTKLDILRAVNDNYPLLDNGLESLKLCIYTYSPYCLEFLLSLGGNRTDVEEVLDLVNRCINYDSERYGIMSEMRDMLESRIKDCTE